MLQKTLGKPGHVLVAAALLAVWVSTGARTAPVGVGSPQIAIGNPLPSQLVGGRISISVAYNVGMNRISAFTLLVDDKIHFSRMLSNSEERGIQYLELDTRTIPDGNHTIKILAMGPRGPLATDSVDLAIRNGVGGLDMVPPLVQFRNLTDGQEVSGKLKLDLLAEDNTSMDLLVSIFVNQRSAFIKNRPPYSLDLDTAQFLDPATGTGIVRIEAWAYDAANNLGKSRVLTLKVRPDGASENQTRARLDPTRGGRAAIVMPDYGPMGIPSPIRTSQDRGLTIPLVPRTAPLPTRDEVAAAPRTIPLPATGPAPKTGRLPAGAAPTLAAVPGGARTRTGDATRPVAPVRRPRSGVNPLDPIAPEPAPVGNPGPRAAAVRPLLPGSPEISRLALDPMLTAPAPMPIRKPAVGGRPSVGPRVAAVPDPVVSGKPSAGNSDQPGAAALNPADPMVVVVDPRAKPNKQGRIPVRVYQARPTLPSDQFYRVRSGDTLNAVAAQFKVSPRAILLANGITDARAVSAGRRLRVPGTFAMMVDNRQVAFDVTPRVEAGIALAPLRQIFEHIGGVVVFYHDEKEIRATSADTEVRLKVGSKEAQVNQVVVIMEREAFIESGRTLVPIPFLEKALTLKAEYDVRARTISLTHP